MAFGEHEVWFHKGFGKRLRMAIEHFHDAACELESRYDDRPTTEAGIGITFDYFADEIGVDVSDIEAWCEGKKAPTFNEIVNFCWHADISIVWMAYGELPSLEAEAGLK